MICPKCNGSGTQAKRVTFLRGLLSLDVNNNPVDADIICSKCNGTGLVPDKKKKKNMGEDDLRIH